MSILDTSTSILNINYIQFMEQQEQPNKNGDGKSKNNLEAEYTRKTQNQ